MSHVRVVELHVDPFAELLVHGLLELDVSVDGLLQVFLKKFLEQVLAVADDQMEEFRRQQRVLFPCLFQNDLCEYERGHILLSLRIDNLDVHALLDDVRNLAQGDVGAPVRVIQTPVPIFF
jgi:hypothetical protein